MGTFQGSPKNGFTENITLCCMVLKIDPGFFNKNWGETVGNSGKQGETGGNSGKTCRKQYIPTVPAQICSPAGPAGPPQVLPGPPGGPPGPIWCTTVKPNFLPRCEYSLGNTHIWAESWVLVCIGWEPMQTRIKILGVPPALNQV